MNERLAFVGRALLRAMRDADSGVEAGFARLRETLSGEYSLLAVELQRRFANEEAIATGARKLDPLAIALRRIALARANGGRITAEAWDGLERHYAQAIGMSDAVGRSFTGTLIVAMATIAVSLVVGATYVMFVLPQFADLYDSMHAELPFLTRFLLGDAGSLLVLAALAFVLVSATLLMVKPAWLYRSRERIWNPVALTQRILAGNRVTACHRRLAFVEYAATLAGSGVAGRKALSLAARESGIFSQIDFESPSDQPGQDELSSAVLEAERLGHLRQELATQHDLRSQALARAADISQIRASFVIRGLLYLLIGALVVAMYSPIFRLGAAI